MLRVTTATRDDVRELVSLMAHAFRDDPPMLALLGDGPHLRERAERLYRGMVHSGPLRAGTIDVAHDGGRIVGGAIWYSPESDASSLWHQVPALASYVGAFGLRGLARARRVTNDVAAYHPHVPHWYLQAIGVRPSTRGRGVGSVLLRHRLDAIDAAGGAAYLESSTDRTGRLYERHGFEPLRKITHWPGAEPWAMWRPAREPDRLGRG